MPKQAKNADHAKTAPPASMSSIATDLQPLRMFSEIPDLIREGGRVAGFERLRDMALEDWEVLCAKMNPYSALKLAIEFDRHAMFAEVASEKNRGQFDRELWANFQDYLHGNVEVAPVTEPDAMMTKHTPGSLPDSVTNPEEEDEDDEE